MSAGWVRLPMTCYLGVSYTVNFSDSTMRPSDSTAAIAHFTAALVALSRKLETL